jgi:hypothetical protein
MRGFKKGDIVMVDESGKAVKYEIVSTLTSRRGGKGMTELFYDARNMSNGLRRTIMQEDILRLATPVDSSEELFSGGGS